jgi:hypothetical protein
VPDTHTAELQAPKAVQAVTPDLFILAGSGLHVSYATSGFDAKPHFTYQDAHRTLTFSGDQIRTVDVPDLGMLVSVTLMLTVDSGSTTFSLMIPRVNLPGEQSVPISTDGITTVHRFSLIPVLNQGQRDFYTVTRLSGSASLVQFFHSAEGPTS